MVYYCKTCSSSQRTHPFRFPKSALAAVVLLLLLLPSHTCALSLQPNRKNNHNKMVHRKSFLQSILVGAGAMLTNPTQAFSMSNPDAKVAAATAIPGAATVGYQALSLPMGDQYGGVTVPVACWYPTTTGSSSTEETTTTTPVSSYPHRISVRRIGQMLVGWNFIPEFVSRDFALSPNMECVNNNNNNLPSKAPVVVFAHGYLGSRFDLSHYAEALAAEGFVCVAPEYPESLAASYDPVEGLDRAVITQQLLSKLPVTATSYGIVGHSLGCGTAMRTGDDTWTRVFISGYNGQQPVPGNVLILSSTNDGVVARRGINIPSDYTLLQEEAASSVLPNRAALVFDRADAPNHISFLAEGVNDAMVDFLSSLLPVAQALSIPVLDFDRYQESRDSVATAEIVKPLVTQYMKQHMKMI
ncbi:expressed unknown protein [Seminavis robusta]|uniref:1-alkyl-2-acetylglycerophosphocholine esterase n=1 Tax=Seminavis robusta TaxID=568900 RepID=A0A9N8DFJ3_9STRA|nr:expressed unknown protein [Seminavis robusta]|eukprot:Sro119_g058260.1 n/a (414) ;mRNA; f:105429-106670